jgi:hypothetical protein
LSTCINTGYYFAINEQIRHDSALAGNNVPDGMSVDTQLPDKMEQARNTPMFFPYKVHKARISTVKDTRSSLQKSEMKSDTLIMPGTVENHFRHILFITMDE